MAAEDPDGQQKYWFMGLPFQGLNRDISEAGTQSFWFQGLPYQFLYPTGGGASWSKSFADTITLTDAIVKRMGLNKADTITLTDALEKAFGKGRADTVTLTDALTKEAGQAFADTITLSDLLAKCPKLVIADTITLSDFISMATAIIWLKSLADTITLTDAIVKGGSAAGGGLTPGTLLLDPATGERYIYLADILILKV